MPTSCVYLTTAELAARALFDSEWVPPPGTRVWIPKAWRTADDEPLVWTSRCWLPGTVLPAVDLYTHVQVDAEFVRYLRCGGEEEGGETHRWRRFVVPIVATSKPRRRRPKLIDPRRLAA